MTERLTILDQIEEDLIDKLKATNGYNFTPAAIKRGLYKWTDFTDKPVVCFTLVADEPHELEEYGEGSRWLHFLFYGYALTDGMGNTDNIHNLSQDVEDFLSSSDNSFLSDTMIGSMEVLEGGVSSPVQSFILEVRILYDRDSVCEE